MAQPSLLVLGCGPVGLVAALRARQLGLLVEVLTDRMPTCADPGRIEVVPAQTVALLVELGLHPRSLGIDKLEDCRRTQWEGGEAVLAKAPAAAHICRPALELGLLAIAEREGVRFSPVGSAGLSSVLAADCGVKVLDATGRIATTATAVVRPATPLVCRTFVQDANGIELEGFSVAACPEGYAYRLGNASQMAFGVVGHGSLLKGDARSVLERVQSYAPWIVQGLDADQLQAGGSGAASLQWSQSPSWVFPIGDARVARDALASQGLAIGFSDALWTVSTLAGQPSASDGGTTHQLSLHRQRVEELVARGPFAEVPAWKEYLEFLRRPARVT